MATTDYYSRPYELVRGQIDRCPAGGQLAVICKWAIRRSIDGVSKVVRSFSSVPTFSFPRPGAAPTLATAPLRVFF